MYGFVILLYIHNIFILFSLSISTWFLFFFFFLYCPTSTYNNVPGNTWIYTYSGTFLWNYLILLGNYYECSSKVRVRIILLCNTTKTRVKKNISRNDDVARNCMCVHNMYYVAFFLFCGKTLCVKSHGVVVVVVGVRCEYKWRRVLSLKSYLPFLHFIKAKYFHNCIYCTLAIIIIHIYRLVEYFFFFRFFRCQQSKKKKNWISNLHSPYEKIFFFFLKKKIIIKPIIKTSGSFNFDNFKARGEKRRKKKTNITIYIVTGGARN